MNAGKYAGNLRIKEQNGVSKATSAIEVGTYFLCDHRLLFMSFFVKHSSCIKHFKRVFF